MRDTVLNWLEKNLTWTNSRGATSYNGEAITAIELSSRINIGALKYDNWRYNALVKLLESNTLIMGSTLFRRMLRLLILLRATSLTSDRVQPSSIASLNTTLVKGGSKWHIVVEGRKATVQAQVDETTENASKRLVTSAEDYASLLKKAWHYCYGREPQPSEAYTLRNKGRRGCFMADSYSEK